MGRIPEIIINCLQSFGDETGAKIGYKNAGCVQHQFFAWAIQHALWRSLPVLIKACDYNKIGMLSSKLIFLFLIIHLIQITYIQIYAPF